MGKETLHHPIKQLSEEHKQVLDAIGEEVKPRPTLSRDAKKRIAQIEKEWESPRWDGIKRIYTAEQVERIRGPYHEKNILAERGANRFWDAINKKGEFISALGAMDGQTAVEYVRAGLEAVYVSGHQMSANANSDGKKLPDFGLLSRDSGPRLVRTINNFLKQEARIEYAATGEVSKDWLVPVIVDLEAGYGGPLSTFELTKDNIDAGASVVHIEDQISDVRQCGNTGGKILRPTHEAVIHLRATGLARDVKGTSTIIIARTDAENADYLHRIYDKRDRQFIKRDENGQIPRDEDGQFITTPDGLLLLDKNKSMENIIFRGNEFRPYSELIWSEFKNVGLEQARQFAAGVPGKKAYNLSPSKRWAQLSHEELLIFKQEIAKIGYVYQFVTVPQEHFGRKTAFEFARDFRKSGMVTVAELQEEEKQLEKEGYTYGSRHQEMVGTKFYDLVNKTFNPDTTRSAFKGSTEDLQFK